MSEPKADEVPQGGDTSAQHASELGPGSILGKYRITKKLGEGGMGVVLAAVHEKLGRSVAIKILRRDLCGSQEQLQRFQREAELVTKIGHPNIVAVYDFGRVADGSLYYVMEVLSGESMRDRLARGPLTDTEVSVVYTQLLSAVKAAHDVGAVHRDLKPDNVMLIPAEPGEPPRVKLLDFGVAKIRAEQAVAPIPEPEAPSDAVALLDQAEKEGNSTVPSGDPALATAAGAIMGTPAYMAPEQIKGASKVDLRADIYAIGIMLFESLIGKRPFNGGSFGELMAQHLFQEPQAPSVAHLEGNLPSRALNWDKLDALVLRMLAKEPEGRYTDCGALLVDLEGVFGKRRFSSINSLPDLTQMEVAQSSANRAERRKKLIRRVITGLVGVGILAGGIGLIVKLSGSDRAPPVDLGKARQQAAKLIAPRRSDPTKLPELMAAVTLSHSRAFLPVIEEALSSEQSEVWRSAVPAAIRLCQPQDEGLRAALAGLADEAVGAMAVDVAVARQHCGDSAAANVLNSLAHASALDDIARLRAVLALAGGGKAPATALRAAFGAALRAGGVPLDLRRNVIVQLLLMKDPEAVRQVEEAAKLPSDGSADDKQRRLEALQALALAHQPRAGDLLYSAAKKTAGDEYVELVLALAESGDSWAPKLVLPLLHDPSAKLRARSAAALARVAEQPQKNPAHQRTEQQRAAAAIEPLLADSDPQVALTAAVLLADEATVTATAPPPRPATAAPAGGDSKAADSEAP